MLHALDFGNVQQTQESFGIKDLSVSGESRTQFKGQHVRVTTTRRLIDTCLLTCSLASQPGGLKKDRYPASFNDGIHLPAVEAHYIAILILDISTGDERHIAGED